MKTVIFVIAIIAALSMLAIGCGPVTLTPASTPSANAPSTTAGSSTPQKTTPVTQSAAPSPSPSTPQTSPVASSGGGTLKFFVTDPPPPEMDKILVDIKDLDVHKEGGDWLTISSNPAEFDLKAIEDIEQYLATQIVDAGKYTQVRLEISSVTIVVGSNEYPAKVPSEEIKLVGNFVVVDGQTTEVTLDFNGQESVNQTGNGDYIFKPVIKLITKSPVPPSSTPPAASPAIASVTPNTGSQGQTLDFSITGTNFDGATAVNFGSGITVNSFTAASATGITGNIAIAADADTGARDILVMTPAGTATLSSGFTVNAP